MRIFLSVLIFSGCALQAYALPAQVVLLRHAEKPYPDEGSHLSAQGYERARAWVGFFSNDARVNRFGPIAALYAMKPKNAEGSVRAIETLEPTSRSLGIPIRSDYMREDVDPIVREISNSPSLNGKTVVICWEHKMIPILAHAFGALSAPGNWPGSVFDQVWFLTPDSTGRVGFSSIRTDPE